jgi:DNA-binding NarL/FixJ family response regulator
VITVAIIEDNRLVREGMADMLNAVPDMEVVLATTHFQPGELRRASARVVLLDVGVQSMDCLDAAAAIRRETPAASVIVMDLLPVHEEIAQLVDAGVAGFILKDATVEEFITTIRTVATGERVLPPPMARTLFSQIADRAVERVGVAAFQNVRLTPREHEVIAAIAEGMSNKEIGQRLNIASHTVKSHVRNVMDKLVLRTRLQIAAYAHHRDSE